ncbi:hypothetical protein C5167_037088 [Papaver somniferum]|uniref:Uncharacterized protein n=1 Tax=Papaver somniferum TaxID=3469 RepID=A0A4Y7I9I0_PAPSO|nr:hypothetical protein C5167_037088 [Papaver somniferum]
MHFGGIKLPCWCFGKFFTLGLLKGEIICTGEMRPALYFEDKKALNLYTGNEICRNSTFTNITVYILKRGSMLMLGVIVMVLMFSMELKAMESYQGTGICKKRMKQEELEYNS